MIGNNNVILCKSDYCKYPSEKYFRPDRKYPEYPFSEICSQKNSIYETVREALRQLGYDKDSFGTGKWNPFGGFIKSGMNVLIKPNMVIESNKAGFGTDCLYTNPSVVAPVIDYIIIATDGNVKITVGDAPVQECDFQKMVETSGYKDLISYYKDKGIDINLVDFRGLVSTVENGVYTSQINEDSKGIVVDLGKDSEFSILQKSVKEKLRVTNYNPENIISHHTDEKNEYLISEYVLNADIIINMPKPKTHRIAGMTASLKNFVGANVRKEYLPHHIAGAYCDGGDESDENGIILRARSYFLDKKNEYQDKNKILRAKASVFAVRAFSFLMKSKYRDGCWYGNRTISKTVTDINKIVYYTNKDGELCDEPQRKILIIADMIISGEGNGPLNPSPKKTGVIVIGTNPVCVDETIAWMMGFDFNKIPTLVNCRNMISSSYSLIGKDVAHIKTNIEGFNEKDLNDITKGLFQFEPSSGWKNHIESQLFVKD